MINASLYGAIKEAKRSGKVDCILGAVHGTAGILNEQFTDLGGLSDEMMDEIIGGQEGRGVPIDPMYRFMGGRWRLKCQKGILR